MGNNIQYILIKLMEGRIKDELQMFSSCKFDFETMFNYNPLSILMKIDFMMNFQIINASMLII